jgi:fructoselysine 3-epimerase
MLCYSTGSLPDRFSLSQIADALTGSPFRGVELVLTAPMLVRADEAKYWHSVRDEFHAKGLAFRNVHLGSPFLMGPEAHRPGLSSLDAAGRARKAQAVSRALMVAAFLDCPAVCLTTGLPESGEAGASHADQEEILSAEIATLAKGLPGGVRLYVEQEPEHVIRSAAQMKALADAFPGRLLLNFDVGHSHVLGEDIGAVLRDLGPRLANIHLEDIAGRVHKHLLYGEGDVDFRSVFAALHDIGYRGDYTPDLYPFKDDWQRALEASVVFLRRHGVLTQAL